MARLETLIVGRQGKRRLMPQQALALGFGVGKVRRQTSSVGRFEVERRILPLCLQEQLAIGAAAAVEVEIEHVLDPLDIHRQTLEPIGQLTRDRLAIEPADLLEVGELGDLHAVAPDLPAQAPGAQRRALPVILDEANVVRQRIDADRPEAVEIPQL